MTRADEMLGPCLQARGRGHDHAWPRVLEGGSALHVRDVLQMEGILHAHDSH